MKIFVKAFIVSSALSLVATGCNKSGGKSAPSSTAEEGQPSSREIFEKKWEQAMAAVTNQKDRLTVLQILELEEIERDMARIPHVGAPTPEEEGLLSSLEYIVEEVQEIASLSEAKQFEVYYGCAYEAVEDAATADLVTEEETEVLTRIGEEIGTPPPSKITARHME